MKKIRELKNWLLKRRIVATNNLYAIWLMIAEVVAVFAITRWIIDYIMKGV